MEQCDALRSTTSSFAVNQATTRKVMRFSSSTATAALQASRRKVKRAGINSCRHRPRSSRTHRIIPPLPEPIPGFPIPLNFANGLLVLTGRTRTPFSSLSNSNLSPGRTPSTRRTSRGTVICPLLVILACFSNTSPPRFPTLLQTLLTLKMMLRLRSCNLVAPSPANAQGAV